MLSDRLIGKPKILIVQACQGDETQRAKEVMFTFWTGWTTVNNLNFMF